MYLLRAVVCIQYATQLVCHRLEEIKRTALKFYLGGAGMFNSLKKKKLEEQQRMMPQGQQPELLVWAFGVDSN